MSRDEGAAAGACLGGCCGEREAPSVMRRRVEPKTASPDCQLCPQPHVLPVALLEGFLFLLQSGGHCTFVFLQDWLPGDLGRASWVSAFGRSNSGQVCTRKGSGGQGAWSTGSLPCSSHTSQPPPHLPQFPHPQSGKQAAAFQGCRGDMLFWWRQRKLASL